MSSAGAPQLSVNAEGLNVAIIAASWHHRVISAMQQEAITTITKSGAEAETFTVAGSFELPLATQVALKTGFDVAVCLGVIVRGETPHFDYVSSAVTQGLTRVQLDTGKPVGFGVLTVDNEQQAWDRSGAAGARESKGREAAEAALHLARAVQKITTGRSSS
ncbi:6,7-dimethyl-8-ribityllumazine synthase [Auritidibacter ignavus]|uniref:6,7-dimethyl-8-ribityllumazine synthase n=1 Tax=Auritidibacter ignavus TaxID=678932 RepID=UPI00244A6465|nr:6,7-dimethyl-8-ribityllumazine synthase [Auritidibacter ignavus]WGH89897.1 6,7-dimethyl-8-ribityllumazine synthase [Auritidibacter ignavus]